MMQNDTRNFSVARDHLNDALDVLRRARPQNERSVLDAAARQALDHLHLAWRRLEEERARVKRKDIEEQAELAFGASQAAWQHLHDMLNGKQRLDGPTLEGVSEEIVSALGAI